MKLDEDVYLEHYGKKGMKWGVRTSNRTPGVSRKIDRDAKKDAAEFARAKAFYGEGSGVRRRLIKQKVEAKAKRSPSYQKAFDKHLGGQDQSKHVDKAISERKRKDFKQKTTKRAGFLARRFTGEMGTQAAFTATAVAGAAFLNSPKGKVFMNKGVQSAKQATKLGADFIKKNMG